MKKLMLTAIRFYRRNISPARPPCCRYLPTCSQYALTAIERFGAFKGCLLAAWRIVRCNPFSKGGYDPVPQKKCRHKDCRDCSKNCNNIGDTDHDADYSADEEQCP